MSFTETLKADYTEESWNIGMRRVNKIADAERQAGFSVTTTGIYSDCLYILVHKGSKLVIVYESINYGTP